MPSPDWWTAFGGIAVYVNGKFSHVEFPMRSTATILQGGK